MRKLLFILIAILAFGTARAEEPKIEFENTTHDFGDIKEEGGNVSCDFHFTNTGDAPLVIVSANAQCGCTTPKFPHRPIQPGDTGSIKVTYSPAGRPGEFVKVVTVKTNDKKSGKLKLKISGMVIPKSK